ncbi:MAG TPA: hypothetical protein VGP13_03010 [Candidatus Paceibacterota bacterium]|jgi:hypothetical protein|nr:hypothetical protein [Candidatus Paceibacterota bacterium]
METLLVIFIGLVAVALVVIAAGIGAVAWYLVKLLQELHTITKRLHEAGELVAEDVARLRSQVMGGGGQFIYTLAKNIWPIKRPTTRRSPPSQE